LALALAAIAPGCVFPNDLIVGVSAPKQASGMTVFVIGDKGLFHSLSSDAAEYVVYYGDKIAYPPGGKGGTISMHGRSGELFLPYDYFVLGNGEYDVVVRFAGIEQRSRVHVEKWVQYVYLHPFDKGSNVEVQVALESSAGGHPEDRILASGELILNIKYRGLDGTQSQNVAQISVTTRNDQTATTVEIARSQLNAGPGYYSFEPLFHNQEARDNLQVGPDPTMANYQPPFNWIYLGP